MAATAKQLGIDRLSVADRLALMEEIWESLVDEADSLEIPPSHIEELNRRLALREANSRAASSWKDQGPPDGPRRGQATPVISTSPRAGGATKSIAIDATIEVRLQAAEEAIQELRRKVEARTVASNWLDRFTGAVEDEQAFDEVVRLGREFRMADRPAEDSDE